MMWDAHGIEDGLDDSHSIAWRLAWAGVGVMCEEPDHHADRLGVFDRNTANSVDGIEEAGVLNQNQSPFVGIGQAGRDADALVVGMGADEVQTLVDEPDFIASVGYFPERYGNYIIPLALMQLAGKKTPDTVLVNHVMVTKANVCKFYTDQKCASGDTLDYKFPADKFAAHLATLRQSPDLKGFENLIPSD